MNDLRLFLLIIGMGVIAGVYIWGTFNARKKQRQQTISQRSSTDDISHLKISSIAETDVDYSSVLTGLSRSISESKEKQPDLMSKKAEHSNLSSGQSSALSSKSDNNGETAKALTEQIVILHIIPRGNETFSGDAILKAANQLDLQFGSMNIFHHYGVGDIKTERALFNLANMMEPGSFDMNNIEKFSTQGLVMFMRLPTEIDEQVVFELMLNITQRLSDLLGADVCDENRSLISEQKIEAIRKRIVG